MYILADIGGTKTRIAGSRDLETMSDPIIYDTPQTYADGMQQAIETIRGILGNDKAEAIVVGVPGVVSVDRSVVLDSNLPEWDTKPIAADLAAAFDTTVHLQNDAVLNGMGEAVFGAGRGARIVVYVTVSTGVGGVRIVDGAVEPAAVGYEIGRQYLAFEEPMTRWNELIAGSHIEKKYGMHPRQLGKEHPVWEELARYTAVGLHNTVMHWSPDRIVLGGSMFNEIGIPVERVGYHLASTVAKVFPKTPEVVHSQLKDVSGLWGGLAYLKQLKTQ